MKRTANMNRSAIANRAAQARAFLESAKMHVGSSLADNSVAGTAAVNAGIAAADAICGKTLGFCSKGEDHNEAVDLLKRAVSDSGPSKNLARLLSAKSLASYSAEMLSGSRTADLVKHAERLVATMDTIIR